MSNIKNIINKDQSNTTLEKAVELIDKSGESLEQWKGKELGLNLTLLGLAEVQALRIKSLATLVYRLEDKVFDPDLLADLDSRKTLELYSLSTKALADSVTYVKDILGSTKWGELEVSLTAMARGDDAVGGVSDATNLEQSKVASELLATIGKQVAAGNLNNND